MDGHEVLQWKSKRGVVAYMHTLTTSRNDFRSVVLFKNRHVQSSKFDVGSSMIVSGSIRSSSFFADVLASFVLN